MRRIQRLKKQHPVQADNLANLKSNDILYLVMPAYNEADNIKEVVATWYPLINLAAPSSRLVIADSGSTDATHKTLLRLQKKYSKLEILATQDKQHGPKLIALYQYAIEKGSDYIFQTDSDGQTNPAEFEVFWRLRKKHNIILGQRKVRGDGASRAFVEKIVCILLRLFFGVKVPDANAPFRLMKTSALKQYLSYLPPNYLLPNIILTAFFAKFEANKLIFKEITFKPRIAGKNSINLKKIFHIGFISLKDFWLFRKYFASRTQRLRSAFVVLTLLLLPILILLHSPSFPLNNGETYTDSSVFQTIARQMDNGLIPYRDSFDHKGPLLYLINYLSICSPVGLFLLEYLTLFATFLFLYQTAKIFTSDKILSLLTVLLTGTLIFATYEGGNLTEEYALPLISLSLYLFTKIFFEHSSSLFGNILIGLSFAAVFLLRANMIALWLVFCPAAICYFILKHDFRSSRRLVVFLILGACFLAVPVLIWLAKNDALRNCVSIYWDFNRQYSSDLSLGDSLHVMLNFLLTGGLLFSLVFSIIASLKQRTFYWGGFTGFFIIALIFASMSGCLYMHYAMVLLPLLVPPTASALNCLSTTLSEVKKILSKNAFPQLKQVVIALLFSLGLSPWLLNTENYLQNRHLLRDPSESLSHICEIIAKHTTLTDKISVYGNHNVIYNRCNRLPATKYSYQFPIGEIEPAILSDYFAELSEERPAIIVVQKTDASIAGQQMQDFLEQNAYFELETLSSGTKIYHR